MFARVTTIQVSPDRLGELAQYVRERVMPTLQGQPGFKGMQVLVNRQQGKVLGIALWDSEEALRTSAEIARHMRAGVMDRGATAEPIAEDYEIAGEP